MKTNDAIVRSLPVWVSSVALICGLVASPTLGDVVLNPPPDVDKTFLVNNETCWMATASNMLAGAGYGSGSSMQARADDIYADMVAQWGTGQGGWPDTALTWWLNSTHNNDKSYPYKTVVPQGHKNQTAWLDPAGPQTIGNHLRDWEYVGIVIYNNLYHAITVWGDEMALSQLTSNPAQIWVADSDTDAGGDVQHYTYDPYSPIWGWRFNYDIPHPTIEGITLLCPVDTATDHTNTQVVVGSWEIFQSNLLKNATDLHYTVSSIDADILSYRTEIDWPRPNNPVPPAIAEDSPLRHLTVGWDLGSDPVPFGNTVTITTSCVLPSWNVIEYTNVHWTYPAGGIFRLPAFRWQFDTPRLWDPNKAVENVTGGFVVGSFDLFTDARGTDRVGRFRGLHEYDYFQDPENHQFELASLGDVGLYVGNIRFGHSYGYLEKDSLWQFDDWMSEYPALQEVVPGQPIAIHLDWEGRLPYPEGPGPKPKAAHRPNPADRATDVPPNAVLSWIAGASAQAHDVYLGTVYADVLAATRARPLDVLLSMGQTADTWNLTGPLPFGQTLYWRVDEVEAPPASAILKGRVWSFTVEPFSYPIANVTATASSSDADMGPEKTIDQSGLYEGDAHSIVATHMWLSSRTAPQPAWIQYAFDKVYKLDQLWVWNSNQPMESFLGYGAKDVTIEYSVDGSTWVRLGDFRFAQATGLSTYTPNTTVQLSGIAAKYVRLIVNRNWGGFMPQSGLSEVRFFYLTVQPRQPDPPDGATEVDVDAVLRWRPGRQAAAHRVWFGTDKQAVMNDEAPVTTVGDPAFDPGPLALGQTYYWKVAEVSTHVWEGDVWSFTTRTCAAVDDFESYTDVEGNRIFDIWIDSWTNGTSSVVGHDEPPYAEQTIVHDGAQSMPLAYDNSQPPYYSETERTFSPPQDWTSQGTDTLCLWVRGLPTNASADLYIVVEDTGGKRATAVNATIVTAATWTQWKIPLSKFSGVNLSKVRKLTIGVGSQTSPKADGTGQLYIDDIGICRRL